MGGDFSFGAGGQFGCCCSRDERGGLREAGGAAPLMGGVSDLEVASGEGEVT